MPGTDLKCYMNTKFMITVKVNTKKVTFTVGYLALLG